MCTCTYTHKHTYTCTYMIHTHRCVHTHTCMQAWVSGRATEDSNCAQSVSHHLVPSIVAGSQGKAKTS